MEKSIVFEALWGTLREFVVEADDILLQIESDLELEIENGVLSKKTSDEIREVLKHIKAASKDLDRAYKVVCEKTGPAVPDWIAKMMTRAKQVSRKMKKDGLL